MEISTLVNFIKIVLTDLEYMYIQMGRNTKASGKVTCKMVLEKKNLKMEASMMECSKTAKKTDKEHTSGLTAAFISVIGKTIISKEKENTPGRI